VKMLRYLLLLAMVSTMVLSACEPQTIEVTRVVEVEKTVEVPQLVEKPVEVTRVVQVQTTPEVVEVTRIIEVDPRFGGSYKIATSAAAPTLDTMTTMAGESCYAGQYMFETLVAYDGNYRVVPMLVEGWEISDDGLTYTFPLRHGVLFHNGKEMTAEDVVASVTRYMDVGPRKGQFGLLQSWEAVDDYTVKFTLSAPSGSFLDALAYPVGDVVIMPKEVIEGKKAGDLKDEDLIGTGPYMLAENKPGELIRWVRFDGYKPLAGPPSGLAGGKIAFFDEVQRIFVPESGARLAGLETGDYDMAEGAPASEFGRLKNTPGLAVEVNPAAWAYMLLINHEAYPSSDVRFRQAVLAALDMDEVALAITNGVREFYRLNSSVFMPEGPWYIQDETAESLYNAKDLDRAKALLDEMGYNGEEVVFVTNRDYDYMFKLIVNTADQLQKKLGINTKVEVLDWPGQRARWEEKETWNFSTTGYYSQVIFNPGALSSFWHCASASSERGFYCSEAMDAAFDQASKGLNYEEQYAGFQEMQRVYYEELPNIKIADFFPMAVYRGDIKGLDIWYRANRPWGAWRE